MAPDGQRLVLALFVAVIGHLVLAFPTGRLHTRSRRVAVGANYLIVTVLQIPSLLFEEDPRNQLVIESDQSLLPTCSTRSSTSPMSGSSSRASCSSPGAGARPRPRSAGRWRRSCGRGGMVITIYAIAKGIDAAGSQLVGLERLSQALLALVPFGLLAGLLRSRLTEAAALSGLVARLGQSPDPGALRAALATALGDPSLALAYWLADSDRFVDAAGRRVTLPAWRVG